MDKYNRKASEDGTFDWDIQDSKIDVNSVKAVLKEVFDPEIHINIHDLGLIYHCDVVDGKCDTVMTLTSPFCPVAGEMPQWVEEALMKVDGIESVNVKMTFDPQFGPDQMSELAQFSLDMYGGDDYRYEPYEPDFDTNR
tara:strand:+ start:2349 stop:2765 length:417 start_codon:yes stop_codon:yes gene_type:complete